VVFTDPDTVREVIHNFNRDGFDALYPRYAGGRPPTFTLPERREIKKIALAVPTDLGQPFATWSLAKLADYLVAEGVVAHISHEALRQLLREEDVRFQAGEELEALDRSRLRAKARPHPGAKRAGRARRGGRDLPRRVRPAQPPAPARRPRLGAQSQTEAHPRQLHPPARRAPPALGLRRPTRPALRPHQEAQGRRVEFMEFCRYLRSLYPAEIRLHFVLDNFSPHKGQQVRDWAHDNNVELAYTPHYASWLNRIEAQFRALRYFTLNGTDHPDHATQARLIRRYIAWRNRHAHDAQLRRLVNTANVA
jgi:transposase